MFSVSWKLLFLGSLLLLDAGRDNLRFATAKRSLTKGQRPSERNRALEDYLKNEKALEKPKEPGPSDTKAHPSPYNDIGFYCSSFAKYELEHGKGVIPEAKYGRFEEQNCMEIPYNDKLITKRCNHMYIPNSCDKKAADPPMILNIDGFEGCGLYAGMHESSFWMNATKEKCVLLSFWTPWMYVNKKSSRGSRKRARKEVDVYDEPEEEPIHVRSDFFPNTTTEEYPLSEDEEDDVEIGVNPRRRMPNKVRSQRKNKKNGNEAYPIDEEEEEEEEDDDSFFERSCERRRSRRRNRKADEDDDSFDEEEEEEAKALIGQSFRNRPTVQKRVGQRFIANRVVDRLSER